MLGAQEKDRYRLRNNGLWELHQHDKPPPSPQPRVPMTRQGAALEGARGPLKAAAIDRAQGLQLAVVSILRPLAAPTSAQPLIANRAPLRPSSARVDQALN